MTPETGGLAPFRIDVPASVLEDLAERIGRARWPGAPTGGGWDYGIEPDYLRRLVEYWRTGYDWRAVEARLNRLPQFIATVEGYRVHLVHERGSGPDVVPRGRDSSWRAVQLGGRRVKDVGPMRGQSAPGPGGTPGPDRRS